MSRKWTHGRPKNLREWREARGLSQRQAARLFGISQPGWGKIERGQRRPRKELMEQLIKDTGVPVETLVGLAS